MAAAKWLGYWLLASALLQLSGWAIGFLLRVLAWLKLSGWATAKCLRLGLAWLWPKWLRLALAGGLASARLLRLCFG